MSKFIDKLGQVSQTDVQPMGFRAGGGAQPKPKMLLVANVSKTDGVAELVAGADAGMARASELSCAAFKKVLQAAPGIPWGAWVKDGNGEKLGGCDFVVFSREGTALTMFQGEELGKILAVESSLGDTLLRAVDRLPVDAVLVDYGQETALMWEHLVQIQRCEGLLSKPLLVVMPASAGAPELQALLTAGVSGVVAEAGQTGRIQELRKAIDALKPPPKRKRGKVEVRLPLGGGGAAEEAAHEEPDEEEEEE